MGAVVMPSARNLPTFTKPIEDAANEAAPKND